MVITPQYYQHLYALQHSGESVQDATGAWVTHPSVWRYVGVCREETNGKGSTIATQDGSVVSFASTIYMPVMAEKVDEGTDVIVLRNQHDSITRNDIEAWKRTGECVAEGKVMKCDNGRLHTRIWI